MTHWFTATGFGASPRLWQTCKRPLADDGRQPALGDVAAHALDLRRVGVGDVLLRREGAELRARPAQLVPARARMRIRPKRFDVSVWLTVHTRTPLLGRARLW